MVTKIQLLEIISELPDEFDREDVIERLIILDRYNNGVKQMNEGKSMPLNEFKKQFQEWRLSK